MSFHIGKQIEIKYKESGMKLSEFAKRLSTSPRNIYDIFERSEIKTDQLQKICEVLNFNFFALYKPVVEEPESLYARRNLSVMVQLDGDEATLNEWIRQLTALNKAL